MRLGAQPTRLEPSSAGGRLLRHDRRSPSGIAIATSSTTSTASSSPPTACRFSGTSPDGSLVEVVELPDHPVVRGRAVSSRIQVEADRRPAAVRRLRRSGGRPQPRQSSDRTAAAEPPPASEAATPPPAAPSVTGITPCPKKRRLSSTRTGSRRSQAEKEAAKRHRSASWKRPPRCPASRRGDMRDAARLARSAGHDAGHRGHDGARPVAPSANRRGIYQPQQAKYLIDTIDVLREKTKGNATPEEPQLMDQLLHQLRMALIARADEQSGRRRKRRSAIETPCPVGPTPSASPAVRVLQS